MNTVYTDGHVTVIFAREIMHAYSDVNLGSLYPQNINGSVINYDLALLTCRHIHFSKIPPLF